MKLYLLVFILTGLFIVSDNNAQNILSCKVDKRFKKNTVYELKDSEQQVVARLSQQKRDVFINYDAHQYVIKKHRNTYYIFYDSIMEDTICIMHKKDIVLKNRADNTAFTIKNDKKGWSINENEDVSLKVAYSSTRKVYNIEIKTPAYSDHLINSLACYYAIRKCKEIYESQASVYAIMPIILLTE